MAIGFAVSGSWSAYPAGGHRSNKGAQLGEMADVGCPMGVCKPGLVGLNAAAFLTA
jgi:hypothetical protein